MKLWHFLIFFILLIADAAHPEQTLAFRRLEVGQKLPAFTAADLAGGQFDSKVLQGQPVVLIFYSTKQNYSEQALKDLGKVGEPYLKQGLRIVAIAVDQDRGEVEKFSKKINLPFTWLYDTDRKAYGTFGVIVTPTTALFDKTGVFRYYDPGHSPDFMLSVDMGMKVLVGAITDAERTKALDKAGQPGISDGEKKAQRLSGLAEDFLKRGQVKEATDTAKQAVQEDPGYGEAKVVLGEALLVSEKYEEARAEFAAAENIVKPPYRAKLGLGAALSRLGKSDEALTILEGLRSVRVDKARLYYELGRVYQNQGKAQQAMESYRKGAEESLNKIEVP